MPLTIPAATGAAQTRLYRLHPAQGHTPAWWGAVRADAARPGEVLLWLDADDRKASGVLLVRVSAVEIKQPWQKSQVVAEAVGDGLAGLTAAAMRLAGEGAR